MSTTHHSTKRHSKPVEPKSPGSSQATSGIQSESCCEKDDAACNADDVPEKKASTTVDQKRNEEQQYHAGGVPHDPHNRLQEHIDSGDPAAGDVDKETREQSAPYNKTYGHHP